jgi:hypothetical protein
MRLLARSLPFGYRLPLLVASMFAGGTVVVAGCSSDDTTAPSAANDGGQMDGTMSPLDAGGSDAMVSSMDGAPGPSGDGGGGTDAAACTVSPVTITHDANFTEGSPQVVFVDNGASPSAICNDGTPAVYFLRPGFGSAASRWNIQLEGGSVCYDQATCAARDDGLLGSSQFRGDAGSIDDRLGSGILSADATQNPDFYDASTVLIHYCSSDYWSGHHAAVGAFSKDDPSTWSFLGRAVLQGVFADLTAKHGLGAASEILLSGTSAGALGAFLTANDIAGYVPAGARLVVLPDAGYYVDRPGFDASAPMGVSAATPTPTEQIFAAGEQLWGATGEKSCASSHDAGDFTCFEPELLVKSQAYPMPLFIRQSEADNIQLGDNGDTNPKTPAGLAYALYYAGQQNAAQSQIPSPYSVFGTADTHHVLTSDTNFTSPAYPFPDAGSLTVAQAVGQWYRDPCTQHLWIQPIPDGGTLP